MNTAKPELSANIQTDSEKAGRTIAELTAITGQSIINLERLMRGDESGNFSAFLGAKESLVERILSDDAIVAGFGLTHAEVAAPLQAAVEIANKLESNFYILNGQKYEFEVMHTKGYKFSPFDSSVKTSREMLIFHPKSDEVLEFSFLVPHLIHDFKFYQGLESNFRIDPRIIIKFFELKGIYL